MTAKQVTEQRFNIRDNQRPLTFTGYLLAESDSQSGNDVRWTELTLYRTSSGRYIVQKIGRSDVYHSDECTRRSKGEKHYNLEAGILANDRSMDDCEPCETCNPTPETSPVWMERDIHSATTFATVEDAIRSLYRVDDGIPRLSHVAQALLNKASETDENVARIMQTPVDVT